MFTQAFVRRFTQLGSLLTLLYCLLVSPTLLQAGTNTWTGGSPSGAGLQNPTLVAAAGSDPYLVYAAYDSDLYRSTDGGRTWALIASFDSITALEVHRSSPSTLYLGARVRPDSFAGVFKSEDSGVTWRRTLGQESHVIVNGFATSAKNSSTVYAFTKGGANNSSRVFRSDSGGDTWNETNDPDTPDADLTSAVAALILDPKEPTTVYAVGYDYDYGYAAGPFFRKSDSGGASWADLSTGLGDGRIQAVVIDPIDPNRILVGLSDSATSSVFRSLNGGVIWSPAQNGLPAGTDVTSLAMDPIDSRIVYAGTGSGVFRTRDGGESWISIGQKIDRVFTRNLAFNASGRVLHAGTHLGAFQLEIDEGSVDVSAEAGQTRLLFWKSDRLSVRTLQVSGDLIGTPEEGPFSAWTATAISDGPDGRSRVLWVNGDGRAGLEIVGASGSEAAFQYPAIGQWSATDVAATRDGGASLLWTGADGAMLVATVDTSGAATLGPQYGPYSGWSALAAAEGRNLSNLSTWVLWRSTDGRVSVSLHRARVLEAAFHFDANPGWAAEDIAVAADGRPRLLRVHRDGRASLATIAAQGGLADERIHTEVGFAPRRISAGPDGATRLLWRSADGAEKVSLLNLDNTRRTAPVATPTPTPAGPPIPTIRDLSGTWRGSFHEPGSSEQIQATVYHSGNHVTIRFGGWEFKGTLRGGLRGGLSLTGSLYCCVPLDTQNVGFLRGEAFATSISVNGSGYAITLSR